MGQKINLGLGKIHAEPGDIRAFLLSLTGLDFTRDSRDIFTSHSRPILTNHVRSIFTTHRHPVFTTVA